MDEDPVSWVEEAFARALHESGVSVQEGPGGLGCDFVLSPGGVHVQVKHRSLVDDGAATRLLATSPLVPGTVLVVVGDRITSAAKESLTRAGAGYLDLRGHLALRTSQIVVDRPVTATTTRSVRKRGVEGAAGLAIAVQLLLHPEGGHSVRQVARDLGRSPSTVSEAIGAMRRDDLVDADLRPTGARLFDEVASRWPTSRTAVVSAPLPDPGSRDAAPLRLGVEDVETAPGWALTGTVAAAVLGAPVAARADDAPDLFVPDAVTLARAVRLLGAAPVAAGAGALLRAAPVPQVLFGRSGPSAGSRSWPVAHPLYVALDLAQDAGRGREVLEDWVPPRGFRRVW